MTILIYLDSIYAHHVGRTIKNITHSLQKCDLTAEIFSILSRRRRAVPSAFPCRFNKKCRQILEQQPPQDNAGEDGDVETLGAAKETLREANDEHRGEILQGQQFLCLSSPSEARGGGSRGHQMLPACFIF